MTEKRTTLVGVSITLIKKLQNIVVSKAFSTASSVESLPVSCFVPEESVQKWHHAQKQPTARTFKEDSKADRDENSLLDTF